MTDAEARQRLEACEREARRKANLRMFDPTVPSEDPFDKALSELAEWDRQCRELHERHMAELAELSAALSGRPVSDERLFPNIAGVKGNV